MAVTIHRDKTFEFNGRRYEVSQGSDQRSSEWDGYTIVAVLSDDPGDYVVVEEGLYRMADVREYLARAEAEGWEYLPDVDGNDRHNPTKEPWESAE